MKLIKLKCNRCGAVLKVNSELNEVYCNFCGNKMIIDDEATNIDRIETAKLKSRKTNHEQTIKEKIDDYELNKIIRADKRKTKIKASIILGIIGIVLMTIGIAALEISGDDDNMFGMFALLGFFPLIAIAFIWMDFIDNDKK